MNNQINNNKLLSLKKAHIPFKTCLKIAFKNIWKKKIRFLIVIIITSISLAFLSFTIELNGDKLRQNVYTMIENGYRYTTIGQYQPLDKESEKLSYYNQFNSVPLPQNSYNTLKEKMPELTIHLYEEAKINYAKMDIENANFFYTGIIDNLILYDTSNTYQLLAGRLPTLHTKEILINDYLVEAFHHFGLFTDCITYFDFIGQHLSLNVNQDYRIVGIIDTPYERWSHFIRETEITDSDKANYSFINDFSMMNSLIINEEYFKEEKLFIQKTKTFSSNDFTFTISNADTKYNHLSSLNTQYEDIPLYTRGSYYGWQRVFGSHPTEDDQIVIPLSWITPVFGYDVTRDDFYWIYLNEFENTRKEITLNITQKGSLESYTKTFTICGITNSENDIELTQNTYNDLYTKTNYETENIIVELPTSPARAYSFFNQAYELNYVIDVWKYRNDIDAYTIDPFINIIAKAGLFVFVVFAMGIMWTVMSIEIVDSKKEIGILRSIGLSGFKVSLIFIIQAFFVNLCAWGLSLFIASKVIPWYNSGIKDELKIITLYLYNFTSRSVIYLLIFVVFMTLLSTIIPLYKITSQKIIDVINERE